ncbi:type ISP restriction/modification enzyme [Actinocorallia lasiicapitis]
MAEFGAECLSAVNGPGQPEAALRTPLEHLLQKVAVAVGAGDVAWHSETALPDLAVRPDYSVEVDGAVVGYIEVKAPGMKVDPGTFRGRNKVQWERLRNLPNLIYTNGTEWRFYREGALVDEPVTFVGNLRTAGGDLSVDTPRFEALLRSFLAWKPVPIRSASVLVERIAPLCRLLRGAVEEQLVEESAAGRAGDDAASRPFSGLAKDWRKLLFPEADDAMFADGYAQAVTFALLLARTEGIALEGHSLHEVGQKLGADHSLMGKALQLLTDGVISRFDVILGLLARVIGAVDWDRIRQGKRDIYLHLYESFLAVYDDKLRQASGTFYTPREVVTEMVRLSDEVLSLYLGHPEGLASGDVTIVDPAAGTGTFGHAIIEHVAARTEQTLGPGARPQAVRSLVNRLIGFEIQMGPFAVAELRTSDLLKSYGVRLPKGGLRFYVTNTLDNPWLKDEQIASTFAAISASREKANEVKAKTPVTLVIGNPPYKDKAEGLGGWIEDGAAGKGDPPLKDFRLEGNGRYEHVLKNLYLYFWRWATWKVFDEPGDQNGIICFITPSGFINGPGGRGMRQYLRRTCDFGWIIDLTPEGQRPDVATRIFPGVAQPLAISIFVRTGASSPDVPAVIRYRKVTGRRAEKYEQLKGIGLGDDGWRLVRTGATDPFTPAAASAWDDFPLLNDLFPWSSLGMTSNRAWVMSPSPEVLVERWGRLVRETDPGVKADAFKVTRDRGLSKIVDPLPQGHPHDVPIGDERGDVPELHRVGFRSYDRQWVIPDRRLIDFPRPELWAGLQPGQLFLNQQSSHAISSGPAVVATALLPDTHHFNGRGGRAHPMLHPDGSANVPRRLLPMLGATVGEEVTAEDLAAYVAAVAGHRGFTRRFVDELVTPGVRVPLTADPALWAEAVELGREVLWASTYGALFHDDAVGRPHGDVLYPLGDEKRVRAEAAVEGVPAEMRYDADRRVIEVGTGSFGPVSEAVWRFDVGGMDVVKKWFGYRKAQPDGKKSSPLDDIHVDEWPSEWIRELAELLSVLNRLVELEPRQDDLLRRVLDQRKITVADLETLGVLPVPDTARKPSLALSDGGTADGSLF